MKFTTTNIMYMALIAMFCIYTSDAFNVTVIYENYRHEDDEWYGVFVSDTPVSEVRKEFARKRRFNEGQIQLTYDGQVLSDSKTLSDYGITDDVLLEGNIAYR
ncbi:hypothetical protein JTB14_036249 [Gonioctena quinquepunctata]|nr:hypothetical protein JTB14_036249 [Gonioctena quinquepunctata]